MKKNLDFMGMRNFSVVLNGSLMKSRVDFDDESLEHDRPLQGQSPYLVNAGLFYQSPKLGLTVGVLYNRIGKRIVGIGRSDMSVGGSIDNDIPDMYEMPRNALDVVVSKSFGKHWELKFNAKDLLNEKVQFAQFPKFENGGDVVSRKQITKQFTAGRMFSLSVTAKFLSESQKFVRVLPSEKIVEVKSTFFNQINYEENFMGSMFDGCVESRRMQRRRER